MSVVFTADGAARSLRYDDVYFSKTDGRAESAEVFLHALGLPEAWAGRPRYRLGELGFGLGLNFCLTLASWRAAGAPCALDYVAFEAAPPPADAIRRGLARWPDLAAIAEELLGAWPPEGAAARWRLAPQARLTLHVGDARARLPAWPDGAVDGWYLDGFSPAKNPELWERDLMAALAARTAPGGRIATYAAAGWVRRNLEAAGFAIEKRPGFGAKRERMQGRLRRAPEAGAP